MSVTVIKGRAGSGKSRFIMERICALIKDPFAKIIVVVPGQLTFEAEKNIMKSCGVSGTLGLEVMSIQRLAIKVLEDVASVSFISSAEKALICGQALESSDFGEGIPDLEESAAELMSRLKSYGQTPESLIAGAAVMRDIALSKKILDTAGVYKRYLELCKGRPDASDMYTLAAAVAGKSGILKDAHLFIDGLDSTSPAVMTFLTEAMRLCADTVASFRSSGDGGDGDLFSSENKDMRSFIEAAERSGKKVTEADAKLPPRYGREEMAYLEANLYRYPYKPFGAYTQNLRLAEAESMDKEVDILAANILTEVRKGLRFRDIAVVGGAIDAYLPVIKAKFALCGIPYFFDERRTLADNAFFEFLYSAVCASAGDMARTEGYVYSMYSPLDFDKKTELKKYAKRYALSGWHYMSEFRRGADSEAAEAIRLKVIAPLLFLSKGIRGKSAIKQIDAVKRFLDLCGAEKKIEEFCAAINGRDTRAEQAYFAQLFAGSIEVLDGISEIWGDERLEPQALGGIVKTGFSAAKIAIIPPSTDEVSVFDISVARLPDIQVLFAIGVHDGVWPAQDAPGIISAAERDAMYEAGLDIGVYDPSAEKLKIYSALVKPKQRLYLSCNKQTGQPSIIIDRIKRLFPNIVVQTSAEYASLAGIQAAMLGELSNALGGARSEKILSACAQMLKQPGWREKAKSILLRTNAALPIAGSVAAELYGGIKCSATRIEGYYRCPYRHFIDYGLKVMPDRDYTNDKVDTGTYMHLALDIFAKTLLEDGADIKSLSAATTEERMRKAAQLAAEQHDNAKLLNDERFALKFDLLQKELIDTAQRIRAHFEGSGASIYKSELSFADYSILTSLGDVLIGGKVDRIDAAGRYFRVVDYKSSAESFSLKEFAGGVALQLPVYIGASRRFMKKSGADMKAAGGYYMRIGDEYGQSKEMVAKASRMAGISLQDTGALLSLSSVQSDGGFCAIDQALTRSGELNATGRNKYFSADEMEALLEYTDNLIKNAAEEIYSGATSINPAQGMGGGDACAYCDYGSVCMMDTGYQGNAVRQLAPADKSLFGIEPKGGCDERME